MKYYYWTYDSWGEEYPPENWEEICAEANKLIDAYKKELENEDEFGIADEGTLSAYSNLLWYVYCYSGELQKPN